MAFSPLNRRREGITRFGIYALVRRCAALAAQRVPSLANKRVSPHVIRQTTAVHLLRAGVDINTIRAWLGHVSLDTTNVYAEVDLEMKAEALSECTVPDTPRRSWHRQPALMAFLKFRGAAQIEYGLQAAGGRGRPLLADRPPRSGHDRSAAHPDRRSRRGRRLVLGDAGES